MESLINLPIADFNLKTTDRSVYLKRLSWFLRLLNNPQNGFKYIHITGTAGKGSTAHFLHEILLASGKKVGSYYSPHPTTDIERIRVGKMFISPKELVQLTEQLKPALAMAGKESPYGTPSYFETFLALAFLYFKKSKCEYVILEAGLGGTHDATNVIDYPLICAITNINYDHQNILGKTLKKIAIDKAGIIKKGSIFFTGEQRKAILKIFKQKCLALKAPIIKIQKNSESNKMLAKAIAEKLNLQMSAIKKGLAKDRISCRFEIIQKNPTVILDGSHNPIKLEYLSRKLKTLRGKNIFIFAQAQDKDLRQSLKAIAKQADYFLITRFLMPYRKTADMKIIEQEIRKLNQKAKTELFFDPWQALSRGLKIARINDNIIITGSFFLAGELRKHWISEEKILKTRKSF